MELLKEGHPLLKTELSKYTNFKDKEATQKIVDMMVEGLQKFSGVGLAANQIGLTDRVFIMGNSKVTDSLMIMFNPVIVDFSNEQIYMDEGCLSYPNLILKIKRPTEIRLRFDDYTGQTDTLTLKGMSARIAQHEIDHLNGIVFTERANRIHLERGRNKQRIHNRRNK